MRREGHLQQSNFAKGVWHDEYLYALLQSEWRARTAPTDQLPVIVSD